MIQFHQTGVLRYHAPENKTNSFVSNFVKILELNELARTITRTLSTHFIHTRKNFWDTTSSLTDEEFPKSFRMSRCDFRQLVDIVRKDLNRIKAMATLRNGAIEAEARVALVLRILSGSSYLDMMLI